MLCLISIGTDKLFTKTTLDLKQKHLLRPIGPMAAICYSNHYKLLLKTNIPSAKS